MQRLSEKQPFSILNWTLIFQILVDLMIIHLPWTTALFVKEWELSENEITEIIRGAEEISGVLWDFSFDHLPCNHRAILVQGQKQYNLSLNGGSWMSISSPDSSIRMGVFDKKFEPFFLSEPAREEDH